MGCFKKQQQIIGSKMKGGDIKIHNEWNVSVQWPLPFVNCHWGIRSKESFLWGDIGQIYQWWKEIYEELEKQHQKQWEEQVQKSWHAQRAGPKIQVGTVIVLHLLVSLIVRLVPWNSFLSTITALIRSLGAGLSSESDSLCSKVTDLSNF